MIKNFIKWFIKLNKEFGKAKRKYNKNNKSLLDFVFIKWDNLNKINQEKVIHKHKSIFDEIRSQRELDILNFENTTRGEL